MPALPPLTPYGLGLPPLAPLGLTGPGVQATPYRVGAATVGTGSAITTTALAWDPGAVAGDLLLMWVSQGGAQAITSTSRGLTQIGQVTGATNAAQLTLLAKTLTSADITAGTVTATFAISQRHAVILKVWRNHAGIDLVGTGSSAAAASSLSIPALTPSVADTASDGAVGGQVSTVSTDVTWTWPGPLVKAAETNSVGAVNRAFLAAADSLNPGPAASGGPDAPVPSTTVTYAAFRVTIKPGPVAVSEDHALVALAGAGAGVAAAGTRDTVGTASAGAGGGTLIVASRAAAAAVAAGAGAGYSIVAGHDQAAAVPAGAGAGYSVVAGRDTAGAIQAGAAAGATPVIAGAFDFALVALAQAAAGVTAVATHTITDLAQAGAGAGYSAVASRAAALAVAAGAGTGVLATGSHTLAGVPLTGAGAGYQVVAGRQLLVVVPAGAAAGSAGILTTAEDHLLVVLAGAGAGGRALYVVVYATRLYRFTSPPVRQQVAAPFADWIVTGPRIGTLMGLTVYRLAGVWRAEAYPSPLAIAAAAPVYLGGRVYTVDQAAADALTVAGYGAYLTLV